MMQAITHMTPVVGIDVHIVQLPNLPPETPTPLPHPHVGFMLDLREYVSTALAVIGSIAFTFVQEEVSDFAVAHAKEIKDVLDNSMVKGAEKFAAQAMDNDVGKTIKTAMDVEKKVHDALNGVKDALGGNTGAGGGGGPVFINGFMRTTVGTYSLHVPGLHFPLGTGFHESDKSPSSDSESFMGSRTVLANGDPLSFAMLPALSCWCAGMEPMQHNGAHTDRKHMSLPTAMMLPIPSPRPVLVGGPPVMNMVALLKGLFKAFRGSPLAKALFKKLKIDNGFVKCIIFDAEPVNSVTGEVVVQQHDFTIDGRLPLEWNRYYASHSTDIGVLGRGWQCFADIHLELVRDGDQFGAAAYFADHAAGFDVLPDEPGWEHRTYDYQNGHAISLSGEGLILRTRDGFEYTFPLPDDWRKQVPALAEDRVLTLPLSVMSDLNGNAWHLYRERNDRGQRLLRIAEWSGQAPTGRAVHCEAGDIDGCLGRMTLRDPQGAAHALVHYEQDRAGNLTAVRDALNVPYCFGYAANHLMVRHTDRNGLSFYYSHRRHQDDIWRVDHAWGDGGLFDYHFTYDIEHLETRFVDSLGHTTILQYNDRQWPVSRIDGLGGVRTYQYDASGRTVAEVDPGGNCTRWDYDEWGNVVSHVLPDGNCIRTKFNENHRPLSVTDPEGGTWRQIWDERGNLIGQSSPSGVATAFRYDKQGQLIEVTNAAGEVTTLAYDLQGRLTTLTDALARTKQFTYDARGNLIQRESPGEERSTYTWDAKGRMIRCMLPGKPPVECAYDAEDNLIRYTDEAGQITRFTYFGQGQLETRVDPDGSVTRYHYDTEERLVGVTNPLGQMWQLKRDAAGQLINETDYYGQSRRYVYDPSGHLIRTIDPLGQILAVTCDPLGRITSRGLEAGVADKQGALTSACEERYAYNRRGQLVEACNIDSTVRRTYDADGRLIGETQHQVDIEGKLDYEYGETGQLKCQSREMRSSVGDDTTATQKLEYTYDAFGQRLTMQIDGHEPIRFTHDRAGRLASMQLTAELGHGYEYDRAGYLKRQTTLRAGRSSDADRIEYAYDVLGNLVARRDGRMGDDQYRYDPLGRIIEHIDPAGRTRRLMYDAHGDRFRTIDQKANGRVLQHADGAKWRLDAAGQLIERCDEFGGKQQNFEWDAFGRLRCFRTEEDKCWRYSYDALGRRIRKHADGNRSISRDVDGGARNEQTWFLWDGDTIAGEMRRPADGSLAASAGQESRFYGYHLSTFEPLVLQVLAGEESQLYYYQNDVNGAPVRLFDSAGSIVWEGRYSVTGGIEQFDARVVEQPIRLQGQYLDQETGLHYNRYRYFDPQTKLFISPDPIGLRGGIAPYAYGLNIFSFADPLGLATVKLGGFVIQVHMNDVDPWPSMPHGHIYDRNWVVDSEGEIFEAHKGKRVCSLSKKDKSLWKSWLKKHGY